MPWYHLFLKYFATDTNTTPLMNYIDSIAVFKYQYYPNANQCFYFWQIFALATKKSFNATHTKETFCGEKKCSKVIKAQEFYFYEIAIFRQ